MSNPKAVDAPYDAIVLGAGAAGLLAAARSAELGRRTLLLEKNRKAGVKILISGGTRCNLTHACDERGITDAFGSAGSFLHSPLAALGPSELVELFHAEDVPTKVEQDTGKIFPQSDRALHVVQALVRRLERCGAEMSLGEAATGIERTAAGFQVRTESRVVDCKKLLIATGGKSFPGCGTTGDAYAWLADWGHTIRPPRPALVPLVSEDAWVRKLAGVTIPDTLLRVVDSESSPDKPRPRGRNRLPAGVAIERRGSLLFTHFGLSGPVVLDVSRALTAAGVLRSRTLLADFLPKISYSQLEDSIRDQCRRDGKRQVVGLDFDPLPRRLVEAALAGAGIPAERRAAELSKAESGQLANSLKRAPIRVSGHRGFQKAEVTAGGVELSEVDSRTMQSKLVPGLYLAGEVLDLDGFIGGYNFQAAFSTGWLAANHL